MPDTPTPGQVAYAAYRRQNEALRGPRTGTLDWKHLVPKTRQCWEAAAQAVLGGRETCRLCHTRLEVRACTRFEDPHWPGCLVCGGMGYVLECPGNHRAASEEDTLTLDLDPAVRQGDTSVPGTDR